MISFFLLAGLLAAITTACYVAISSKNELIQQLRSEINEVNEERKLWANKALVREHQGRIFVGKHQPVTSAEIVHQQANTEKLAAAEMLPPYTAAVQS